jgi:glutamate dehydrogenase (NAD(P)+)
MNEPWQEHADAHGPKAVIFVREPTTGLDAVVVVDNVAAGPAIGGVRMAPDVTVVEVMRLARAMTLKNAMAGLPHGGAKSGITADPGMSGPDKERLIRAFARSIRDVHDYIPGPDMGLDETCMAWIHDEIGRVVGLPPVLGGIPLDILGATGFGVAIAAEAVEEVAHIPVSGARVAIEGFGAVGRHAARCLADRGARIIAVSDSRGAVLDPTGLPLADLMAHKDSGASVHDFSGGQPLPGHELLTLDCDILVPAARPDVFTAANAPDVKARVILQGANIPATLEAEELLHERGVVVVPDFVANAGGVICASVEYHGGSATQAFATIEEKIRTNTREVLERARGEGVTPRTAAQRIAWARVDEAMGYRRR